MARCQRVVLADGLTWTVVDDSGQVVGPVEEYLEFGRQSQFSANTIRSYATALALWMSHLGLHGRRWDQVEVKDLAGFAGAVRRGSVGRLDVAGPVRVAESTVAARVRPVLSFYRFQQASGRSARRSRCFSGCRCGRVNVTSRSWRMWNGARAATARCCGCGHRPGRSR